MAAFRDEGQRPAGVKGDISLSFGQIAFDWISDDGRPEDKYDPELAMLFWEATAGLHLDAILVQEFISRLESKEPELVPQVLVNNPEGIDTMLIQFQALTGDPGRTLDMAEETEKLWLGHDREITLMSQSIVSIEVSKRGYREPKTGNHYDHRRCPRHTCLLLLGNRPPTCPWFCSSWAHHPVAYLCFRHDGAAWHPLYTGDLDNHGTFNRDRR